MGSGTEWNGVEWSGTECNRLDCTRGVNACDWIGNRLQSQFGRGVEATDRRRAILIASLDISTRRMGGLGSALQALQQVNV